jgi:hypothetical protein
MKKLVLIFAAIVLIMSCEKHDNTCGCDDPLQDLAWLNELKSSITNCSCQVSIFQATYNKETVFYAIMNDPLCNSFGQIVLLDCEGNSLKVYELPLGDTFSNEVTDPKVLYTCKTK